MADMEESANSLGNSGNGEVQIPGDQGAEALVLDLAKAFERVSLLVVWAWRRTSASRGRYCWCYAGASSTRGECSLKVV